MKLFDVNVRASQHFIEKYKPLIGKWCDYLDNKDFTNLDRTLNRAYKDKFLPNKLKTVFRIYRIMGPKDIKVVILGQDPYPQRNQANGFAFGCNNQLSDSLEQIMQAIHKVCSHKPREHSDYTLAYLVKQRVFLTNTALTVKAGKSGSHEKIGWADFTKKVIQIISENNPFVVWMLWGKKAQKMRKYILNRNHKILTEEHPAFAAREYRDWYCDNFNFCNTSLKAAGKKPIAWTCSKYINEHVKPNDPGSFSIDDDTPNHIDDSLPF